MTDTTADLIDIQNKYPGTFIVAMEYKKQQRRGAVEQAYLREEVARRLYVASNLLPDGFQFKILDAWRAYETQKDIYDEYYKQLLDQGYSQEETDKKILEFVSYPSVDPLEPFLHGTGGAVDLTILNRNQYELDMGTPFDDFTEQSHTFYFHNKNKIIHKNRMLLYNCMCEAGFTNLETEWWHYDFGDAAWARQMKKEVLYNGILSLR